MATLREDPYGRFKFKVTINPASGGEFRGGFSEFSGLNTEITYADYREGTEPANRPRKIPLIYKAGDVTLKRRLIASLVLWQWVNQACWGNMDARATVVIQLMSEGGADTVAT
jgi:phage tail-like protein